MILEHGGMVELTLTKNTTAMIAENLPMSKLRHYSQTNSSLIVATPEWIVQSVSAKRSLNPNKFRLLDAMNPNVPSNAMLNFSTKSERGIRCTLTDPDFVSVKIDSTNSQSPESPEDPFERFTFDSKAESRLTDRTFSNHRVSI